MSVFRLIPLALSLGLGFAPALAQEEEFDSDRTLEKAARAYFHLEVSGVPATAPAGSDQVITQSGKAFAIGPDLLLTASHVLGDWSDWQAETGGQPEVIRALRPVKRTINLTSGEDRNPLDVAAIVMPTFAPMIDATTIRVPNLGVDPDDTFQLSLCDIENDATYFALVTLSETPSDPASIREPGLIELVAQSYEPEKFGGLYVFKRMPDDGLQIDPSTWGHDGAPILSADGTVVALVSAVVIEGEKTLVLATPVQSLIPGTSGLLSVDQSLLLNAAARPKCSMVDLVDRMARKLEWEVRRFRENGRLTNQIVFAYDTVAEPPTIGEIEVRTSYLGTDTRGKYGRLQVKGPNAENGELVSRIDWFFELGTEFRDAGIISAGEELMKEAADKKPGDKKPRIMSVRFTISPVINGEVSADSKEIELQWSELVGDGNAG